MGVLHGVVEMPEMSQVDAQPRKSVLLKHGRPENRICPILIIRVWPKAMAGMRHDGHIIGAAPRVELCEGSIELAADMRSQPRIGGAQKCWLVEVRVGQMFVVGRPKSHRRETRGLLKTAPGVCADAPGRSESPRWREPRARLG